MNQNPVEQYLKEQIVINKNDSRPESYKMLSLKKISKSLNLKRRHVYKYCLKSENVRKVKPLEVGSLRNKININVFTYKAN
jgi:hypothetical protein